MKKNIIIIAVLLGALVSCTKNFERINTDPNNISRGQIQPSNVIEPVLIYGSNEMIGETWSLANEISQVTAAVSSNIREEHRYNLNNGNFAGRWNAYYEWSILADHMYNLALAQGDENYQAIGLTMKVYYMQGITDLFGGIAYKEGMKADKGIVQPVIESQHDVYEDMFADLEKANSLYNTQKPLPSKEKDAMYKGDINKWRKFTNTLYLRLLNRVSGRNDSFSPTIQERMAKIFNDPTTYPVFVSNEDNAHVHFSGATQYYSNKFRPLDYPSDSNFSGEHHICDQFLGMLILDKDTEKVDPRLRIWCKQRLGKTSGIPEYSWFGTISGCSSGYASGHRSDYLTNDAWLNYDALCRDVADNIIMDYDELLFIKAEAALKGWISGNAKDYYEQAIAANCKKWNAWGEFAKAYTIDPATRKVISQDPVNITDADIAALIADPKIAWDGTEQRLAEQKWLSLFWVAGWEMYHQMRRTGYPEIKIGKGVVEKNATGGKFCARMPYPIIAISNNNAHYLEEIKRMGGSSTDDNLMTLPVWWSGEAIAKDAGSPWPHAFRKLEYRDEN